MIGLNWRYFCYQSPYISVQKDRIQSNYVLQYFLNTFVYFVMGIIQIIARKAVSIWYPICYHEIVDLCTIANVSIFIIDQNMHGYYIHGENPVGFSEGSA